MIKTSTDVGVVAAQLVAWSALLLLSDFAAVLTAPVLIVIVIICMALLITSHFQLGRSYSSLTRPRESNVLVQGGYYRFIRPPIYLGLFIVGSAFTLSNLTLQVVLVYFLMLLVTNIRADLEEGMLEKTHPEYKAYQERTKRYIPYLY